MYTYGADIDTVLAFSVELSPELDKEVGDRVRDEYGLGSENFLESSALAQYDEDPDPWQSRVASEVSIELIQLYSLADRYVLQNLKQMIYPRLRSWINTA